MKLTPTLFRPRSAFPPLFAFATFALLGGCGGSGSSDPTTGIPSAFRLAVGPDASAGTVAFGYDESGKPVFVQAHSSGTKWTVYRSASEPLYDLSMPSGIASRPIILAGNTAFGSYDEGGGAVTGVCVSTRKSDGSNTVKRYPGYDLSGFDGSAAFLWNQSSGAYKLLSLADGKLTDLAIPSGSDVRSFKGSKVLCVASNDSQFVFHIDTGASVALKAPADSDGETHGFAVTSSGLVLGTTNREDGRTDMRLWDQTGNPGDPIDWVGAEDHIEPSNVTDDGQIVYAKWISGKSHAYMRVLGTNYDLKTTAFPLQSTFYPSPSWQVLFGREEGIDPLIAVGITYRPVSGQNP